LKLLLLIVCLPLLSWSGEASAQANAKGQCNQIDQVAQTRCQLEKAFLTGNISLARTIFAKSTYADANDSEACGRHTYVQCILRENTFEALDLLFANGLDANLIHYKDVPIIVLLIESGPQQTEEYGRRVIETFVKHDVQLEAPMSMGMYGGAPDAGYIILSICKADFDKVPRARGALKALIDSNIMSPSSIRQKLYAIADGIRGHYGMESAVERCERVDNYAACMDDVKAGRWFHCNFPDN
jgi:hypothetical protein